MTRLPRMKPRRWRPHRNPPGTGKGGCGKCSWGSEAWAEKVLAEGLQNDKNFLKIKFGSQWDDHAKKPYCHWVMRTTGQMLRRWRPHGRPPGTVKGEVRKVPSVIWRVGGIRSGERRTDTLVNRKNKRNILCRSYRNVSRTCRRGRLQRGLFSGGLIEVHLAQAK